jgi:hypothetical protein
MTPYLSFTVHFIDSEFNLHAKCLNVTYFPEDHTGLLHSSVSFLLTLQLSHLLFPMLCSIMLYYLFSGVNIQEALESMIGTWSLPSEGLVCLATVNGSNMIRAAEIGGWQRLPCFGHNLHNAVNNALSSDARIGKAVGGCRLVSFST